MFDDTILLTPKEVAKVLKLNVLTVYEFIRLGKLPIVKLGRAYRIRREDLHKFITDHIRYSSSAVKNEQ